jgi:hypothetical protein
MQIPAQRRCLSLEILGVKDYYSNLQSIPTRFDIYHILSSLHPPSSDLSLADPASAQLKVERLWTSTPHQSRMGSCQR